MKTDTIVCCVVALLLGMLIANMLKNVCGCKLTEGQNPLNNNNNATPGENINNNANSGLNNNNNNNNNNNPCAGVSSQETDPSNIPPECFQCLLRAGWTGTAIGEDVDRWESCRGDSPDTGLLGVKV